MLLQGLIGKNAKIRIFRSVWLHSVSPRDQASKSKIQGERPFIEPGDHSSSKETVHRETRLFVEGGRRVFIAGEGVHCGRGCALQERAFVAGEGIHCRRGYSSQERVFIAGGREEAVHRMREEAVHRTREEGIDRRRRAFIAGGRRPSVAGGRRLFVAGERRPFIDL